MVQRFRDHLFAGWKREGSVTTKATHARSVTRDSFAILRFDLQNARSSAVSLDPAPSSSGWCSSVHERHGGCDHAIWPTDMRVGDFEVAR